MSVWELEAGPPPKVRHKTSGLALGKGYCMKGAKYLYEALTREFPELEIAGIGIDELARLKGLLVEAIDLKPERKMKRVLIKVTMEIPVWASSEEQALQVAQEMEDAYELWDYTEDFGTVISVSSVFPDDYQQPAWVITPAGLEEVERAPFKPVQVPEVLQPEPLCKILEEKA